MNGMDIETDGRVGVRNNRARMFAVGGQKCGNYLGVRTKRNAPKEFVCLRQNWPGMTNLLGQIDKYSAEVWECANERTASGGL